MLFLKMSRALSQNLSVEESRSIEYSIAGDETNTFMENVDNDDMSGLSEGNRETLEGQGASASDFVPILLGLIRKLKKNKLPVT